jgi:hypothetical protein
MDSKFDILKKAIDNGVYNVSREGKLTSAQRHELRASVDELEKLGYLSNSGSKIVYYITELGKLVVSAGGFTEFEQKKSDSSEFQIIAKTFKEVSKIHSENQSSQKLVKLVSIITGLAIVVQSIFTVLLYFGEKPEEQLTREIVKQITLTDSLSSQLELYQSKTDSLKAALHRLSMKKDSTYTDSIKVKNK